MKTAPKKTVQLPLKTAAPKAKKVAPRHSPPAPANPADLRARRDAYGAALHRLRCRAGTLSAPLKAVAGQHLKVLAEQLRTFPQAPPKKARARFERLLSLDAQGMPGIRTWAANLPVPSVA